EEVAVVLAAWSGVAIENARLYDDVDRRRAELERALRGLEASSDVARTVAGGIELPDLLELIAKRGRGVVNASSAFLLLSDGTQLEVASLAGDLQGELAGRTVPDDDRWLNELQARVPQLRGLATIAAPLELRGRPRGLLVALAAPEDGDFDAHDQRIFG